jgi:hypothetical protein
MNYIMLCNFPYFWLTFLIQVSYCVFLRLKNLYLGTIVSNRSANLFPYPRFTNYVTWFCMTQSSFRLSLDISAALIKFRTAVLNGTLCTWVHSTAADAPSNLLDWHSVQCRCAIPSVSKPRPARLCYAARSHVCKLVCPIKVRNNLGC